MEITKDDIEDLYLSIGFYPPKTNIQIRPYYEIYKYINTDYSFTEILQLIGLTPYRIETFKKAIAKKWIPKKLEESTNYYKQFQTEIRAIMEAFVKK